MRLIDKDEVLARVFIDYVPNMTELHINFEDSEYDGCKELVEFFRSLGLHVESDGIAVVVSVMKGGAEKKETEQNPITESMFRLPIRSL